MSAPAVDPVRITHDTRVVPPRCLMVLVSDHEDVIIRLVPAADRARIDQRPVLVGLVEPPRPLTIDAAIQARYERRRAEERAALITASLARCVGVPGVSFVHIRQPRALTTERARRILQRKAERIAVRARAVLLAA